MNPESLRMRGIVLDPAAQRKRQHQSKNGETREHFLCDQLRSGWGTEQWVRGTWRHVHNKITYRR